MYGCESWTIKKAGCWRIDAFELWYWRRLLRVPWTARSSNQSILKEMNPEPSFEGLLLKLKLQYFSHLLWRADSLEKTLMQEMIEGRRRRGQQRRDGWMASLTEWWWARVWASSRRWWRKGKPDMLPSMGLKESDRPELLNNSRESPLQLRELYSVLCGDFKKRGYIYACIWFTLLDFRK